MDKRPMLMPPGVRGFPGLLLGLVLVACGGSTEPPPPVATVEVTPTTATRLVGQTVQLAAVAKDAGGNVLLNKSMTWSTSSAAIASVSVTGLVTGVADGTATITAAVDGKSGTSQITIVGPCSTSLATTITVGQTISASLATTDCRLDDASYADGYALSATSATTVQIDMTSTTFDTYLVLFELLGNGTLVQRAENDDISPTVTDSRLTFTLNAGTTYFILANSFDPGIIGNYQLRVSAVSGIAGRVLGSTKPGKAPVEVLKRAIRYR